MNFLDSTCTQKLIWNHAKKNEFFSLPLFPQALCDEDSIRARNLSCTCGNSSSTTGLGCGSTYGAGGLSTAANIGGVGSCCCGR